MHGVLLLKGGLLLSQLDAMHYKVRDEGRVTHKARYPGLFTKKFGRLADGQISQLRLDTQI